MEGVQLHFKPFACFPQSARSGHGHGRDDEGGSAASRSPSAAPLGALGASERLALSIPLPLFQKTTSSTEPTSCVARLRSQGAPPVSLLPPGLSPRLSRRAVSGSHRRITSRRAAQARSHSRHLLSHMVPVEEPESSSTGCLGLEAPREVTVKVSAGAAVTSKPERSWNSHFPAGSRT